MLCDSLFTIYDSRTNRNYLRNIVTSRAVKVSILVWRVAVWFLDTFLIVS